MYYRALYSQEHFAGWNCAPVANSSHHRPSTAWTATWQKTGKTDEPDRNYPLFCSDNGIMVRFTARARETFLANPRTDYSKCSDQNKIYAVGELDGVCAFETPTACRSWALAGADQAIVRNNYLFVVFEGDFVCEAPDDKTAVVVRVLKKFGSPMRLQNFEEKYLQ